MALVTCKECGKQISNQAKSCPGCGAEIPRTSNLTMAIAIFLGVVAILAVIGSKDSDKRMEEKAAAESQRIAAMNPAQRAADDKRKAIDLAKRAKEKKLDGARGACQIFVTRTLHDPDSAQFDGNYWAKEEKPGIYHVQIHLRAKNAFNALRQDMIDCRTAQDKQGNWFALSITPSR